MKTIPAVLMLLLGAAQPMNPPDASVICHETGGRFTCEPSGAEGLPEAAATLAFGAEAPHGDANDDIVEDELELWETKKTPAFGPKGTGAFNLKDLNKEYKLFDRWSYKVDIWAGDIMGAIGITNQYNNYQDTRESLGLAG